MFIVKIPVIVVVVVVVAVVVATSVVNKDEYIINIPVKDYTVAEN